ncbi:MAG: glycerophosphodiester phosphodiesterase [Candidatus Saccharimonadales bacterium]
MRAKTKLQIIGHRGAAGLALENSQAAFRAAVKLGVEAELDIHLTRDGVLVVNHDASLMRTAHDLRTIRRHTWQDLKSVKLRDGSPLLRLEDALHILQPVPVMIEIKDRGCLGALLAVLAQNPKNQVVIASFKHKELVKLKRMDPSLTCFPLARFWPGEAISLSRRHKLGGVGIPVWGLNPLSYLIIRRSGLQAYTYTANRRFMVRLIHRFYPKVAVCTNYPDRFVS